MKESFFYGALAYGVNEAAYYDSLADIHKVIGFTISFQIINHLIIKLELACFGWGKPGMAKGLLRCETLVDIWL